MATIPGNKNISVTNRNNRPSPSSRVLLELYTLEAGSPYNIYEVHSVHVFPKGDFNYEQVESQYFVDYETGLVSEDQALESAVMIFSGTENGGATTLGCKHISEYTGDAITSQDIYQMYSIEAQWEHPGLERYGIVLHKDSLFTKDDIEYTNGATHSGDYFDVWTVTFGPGEDPQLLINEFTLYPSNRFHFTEPLHAKAKARLKTNKLKYGSKEEVILSTSVSILNKNIGSEIIAMLRHSLIEEAEYTITRYREDGEFPQKALLKDWTPVDTIDSDDTLSFMLDTTELNANELIINPRGMYHIQVRFSLAGQIVYSDEFPLIVE